LPLSKNCNRVADYDESVSGFCKLYMPTNSPNIPTQVSFRSVPCISVLDIQQSVDYYCQKLGFSQEWIHVDQVGNTAMVGLQRNGIEIFLDRKLNQSEFRLQLYIELDPTNMLNDLHREFEQNGAIIIEPPKMRDWGWTVMVVSDLDSNILKFCGDEREDLKPI
jgi:uncharacterized glyoxalase superfamily protein PhnB